MSDQMTAVSDDAFGNLISLSANPLFFHGSALPFERNAQCLETSVCLLGAFLYRCSRVDS